MSGTRLCWLIVLVVAWAGFMPAAAGAAPPWEKLLVFNRVEADPEKTYQITEENGPWMIMACSFSGEQAEQQARNLVYELRKRYKLPAYMHEVRFDFGEETSGRGIDRYGAPRKMRYRRGGTLEEIAVLVGDYPYVDAPEAQRTLKKIKYSQPDCLKIDKGKSTTQSLAGWRLMQKHLQAAIGSVNKEKGPMGHAFVTTNPLLPREYYVPKGVSKLVLRMNKNVKHSLLDCPGRYSVQVAHFTGKVILDQDDIQAIESGEKKMKSSLDKAAEKAHKLTEALRAKGYEAYEFHDRYASIVTVGSFNSVGTPRPDGKTEINPNIHAIMKTFGADQTVLPGQPAGTLKPKLLANIPFDIQPIPVQVPRRSVSQKASHRAIGLW